MLLILITGANKGIGFEVARQLARAGHRVLLAARDPAKAEAAVAQLQTENLTATPILLDVTQPESLQQAAVRVKEAFGKLDVLINNAAILLREDHALNKEAASVFQQTWRTNVEGPLLVTQQFLPLMPAGGRVIMTSSGGGSMTDPVGGWSPAYCVSKSALNAITRHLAFELEQKHISVNAYCPGWVRTDMGGSSAPRDVLQGADTAVWLATVENTITGKFFRDRKVIPW